MKNAPPSKFWLVLGTFAVLLIHGTAFAHSGGTNSEGCHTNSKTGDYHCHNSGTSGGGGSGGGSTYTPTPSYTSCDKPNEMISGRCTDPVNACIAKYGSHSEYTNAGCGCEDGYQLNVSKTGCEFANAASSSSKDDKARAQRQIEQSKNAKAQKSSSSVASSQASSSALIVEAQQAKVQSITDGDTLRLKIGKKTEKLRIIGIDTPETVDPRKPVQCFGKEATAKLKSLLSRKTVTLEKNPAEDRDKYKRLLRYVFVKGEDIGATMIHDGFAFSYKQYPHPRLEVYNALEIEAREAKRGLWGTACDYAGGSSAASSVSSSPMPAARAASSVSSVSGSCNIKGNISVSAKEKIFHVHGCGSYNATVIDASAGERMFCTEAEAVAAGWRKALNCP